MDEKDQISPEIEQAANALELQAEAEMTAPATETTPAAAPVTPETPAVPVSEQTEKAKKPKTGLIVGISAAALLVLGGGGVGVAYALTHTPENITLSAFSKTIGAFSGANSSSISGTISYTANTGSSSSSGLTNCSNSYATNCVSYKNPLEKVELSLLANTDKSNQNATSAVLKVTYDGETYEVSLGSVVIKDYTLYVSVDGLKEAASKLVKSYFSDDYEDYGELYQDLVDTIAGEIDGQWWKISVSELVDEVDELSSSDKTRIKDTYSCVTSAISKAQGKINNYTELYRKNAFVNLTEYKGNKTFSGKGTAYVLSFNAEKYANFANGLMDELIDLGVDKCIATAYDLDNTGSRDDYSKITADDVEDALESLPDIIVTVNKGLFDNDLTGIYVEKEDKEYTGKIDLTFGQYTGEIKTPDGAKSATELYKNVMDAYEEWEQTAQCKYVKLYYPEYYSSYCDAKGHPLSTTNNSTTNRLLNV